MTQAMNVRTALVTGAANGIGKAMVAGLLTNGYRVAAVDRDAAALDDLRATFQKQAEQGLLDIFLADLGSNDCLPVIENIRDRFGYVDILINNAGVGVGQFRPDYHTNPPAFWDVPVEQWLNAVAINTTAVFMLCHAVVRPMMERRWGRIINVTTSLGTMLRYGTAPYGPSKAATESLSAVMAEDLKGTGVTVNIIIPGGTTNTPMVPPGAPFAREALLQPEVMVPPLLWLLSSEADHITNSRILAKDWDTSIEPAKNTNAPIGWPSLAVLPVVPSDK